MAKKYDKIEALFKEHNKDLYVWVLDRAKEEDISVSAFVVRALKKIRELEGLCDGEKEIHDRGL